MARISLARSAENSHILRWLFIAFATFVCCWLAAVQVDWSRLGSTMGELKLVPLFAGWMALIGFYFLRALRWRVILEASLSVPDSFAMSSVAYLVNSAIPLQGGELVKVKLLNTRTGMPYARGLASILTERILDVGAIVLLLALCLTYGFAAGAPQVDFIDLGGPFASLGTQSAVILAVGMMAALGLWILIRALRGDRRLGSLGSRVRKAAVSAILETWHVLKVPNVAAKILTLTATAWTLNLLSVWLTSRALGLSMTPFEVSLCFCLVTLGLSIPLTPGYVGQYELLWLEVMQLLSLSLGPSGNHLSLVLHAMILLTILALGIAGVLFLARRKTAWASVAGTSHPESFSEPVQRQRV